MWPVRMIIWLYTLLSLTIIYQNAKVSVMGGAQLSQVMATVSKLLQFIFHALMVSDDLAFV